MAALTITVSDLAMPDGKASLSIKKCSEGITPGQAVYLDANGEATRADANSKDPAHVFGVAMTYGSANEYIAILTKGILEMGAILTKGTDYYASNLTLGGIGPFSDLASGDFPTLIGRAKSTSELVVAPDPLGVAI